MHGASSSITVLFLGVPSKIPAILLFPSTWPGEKYTVRKSLVATDYKGLGSSFLPEITTMVEPQSVLCYVELVYKLIHRIELHILFPDRDSVK